MDVFIYNTISPMGNGLESLFYKTIFHGFYVVVASGFSPGAT